MDVSNSDHTAAAPRDMHLATAKLFQNSLDFLAFIVLGIGTLGVHAFLVVAGTQSGWLRTLPVWMLPLLILVFFGLGLYYGRHCVAQSRQRFADNLYFLGFIFTMSSLIATFLPAAWSQSLVINSNSIYSAFGTALISTALGLILRVVVMQMAPSADEMSLQLEEDLTQLTARVAAEARAIGNALADARGKIAETNEANVKSVLSAIAPRLEALVGEFGKATDDATALLRTQAEATRSDAEALRIKLVAQTSDITEAAQVLAGARQSVASTLNGLAGPVSMLGKEVAEAGAAAAETTRQLRAEIVRLAASFAAAAAGSDQLIGAIDSMTTRTTEQGGAIGAAIAGLSNNVVTGGDRVAVALADVERIAGQTATEAGAFQGQIDAAMVAFSRAVERFAGELDTLRAEAAAPAAAPIGKPIVPPPLPRSVEPMPTLFTPPPV